jgi:hypothetical protein
LAAFRSAFHVSDIRGSAWGDGRAAFQLQAIGVFRGRSACVLRHSVPIDADWLVFGAIFGVAFSWEMHGEETIMSDSAAIIFRDPDIRRE